MGSIGNYSFKKMYSPQMPKLSVVMEEIDRKGKDGVVFCSHGRKAQEVEVNTVAIADTLNEANSASERYRALIGSAVTMVDDQGRTIPNVMILDVNVYHVQKVAISTPIAAYLVYAIWRLKATGQGG